RHGKDKKESFCWGAFMTIGGLVGMVAAVGVDKNSHATGPHLALEFLFGDACILAIGGIGLLVDPTRFLNWFLIKNDKKLSLCNALSWITLFIIWSISIYIYNLLWYSFCVSRP